MMHHLMWFGLMIALVGCSFTIPAPSVTHRRSSPLPIPDDATLARKSFGEITFTFKKAG